MTILHDHLHRGTRRSFLFASAAAALSGFKVLCQDTPLTEERFQRFRSFSEELQNKGISEPFRGITAEGALQPGLFPVRPTGVSTESVRRAAERFLSSLNAEQRNRTLVPVDSLEWRKWMNTPHYRRSVSFEEMDRNQREAAFGMMRASLSPRGMRLTRDIMRLNETAAELAGNPGFGAGEWAYYITILGRPSLSEPWGWQFDGHHAIINYFVLGDQVVMTPYFAGSDPVRATSGKYKGTVVLQEEQQRGFEFLGDLDEAQRAKAVLSFSKAGKNNVAEAFKDNVVLDYAGLPANGLHSTQQQRLMDLIELFVSNMDEGHARVKMDEVRRYRNNTTFAWIGEISEGGVFYYRIHSPVILIEFDHQSPGASRFLGEDPKKPTRQHIHVVVRTPNGNDYGKDLLRQHYLSHPH
jgi:hypothetical protein